MTGRELRDAVYTAFVMLGWCASGCMVPLQWLEPAAGHDGEAAPARRMGPLTPDEAAAWRVLVAGLRAEPKR